jgi:hypothetical protein
VTRRPDGREHVLAISALLDQQLDIELRRRIGAVADRVRPPVEPVRPPVGPTGPVRPPTDRLTPGRPGPQRLLPVKELGSLVRRAVAGDRRRVVWTWRGNEALVHLDTLRLALDDGLIFIGLTLETTQTGPQELTAVLAVGSKDRPAGLLAVAEERPRGHGELAATFAEAVNATAWRGVLLVVAAAAASAGRDAEGDPLVPLALTAAPEVLIVHTIADHRLGRPSRR